MKKNLFCVILVLFLTTSIAPGNTRVQASSTADPSTWQTQATGMQINQTSGNKTAGLSFIVQSSGWPRLSIQGGVKNSVENFITALDGVDLGMIKDTGSTQATLTDQSVDWSHNILTFSKGSTQAMKLWASRLSPAILINTDIMQLRFFSGNVTGYVLNGDSVSERSTGPAYPKYVAFPSNGGITVKGLSQSATSLSLDDNWMLVWYGKNSPFIDTKTPTTYSGIYWENATLPASNAYQADSPMLFIFDKNPSTVKNSSEGGVELGFPSSPGYISLLPILGRNHPSSAETEGWASSLPAQVSQAARDWSGRLCSFPSNVSESYSYDSSTDSANIGESFNYIQACADATKFAPVSPMLGLVSSLSGLHINGSVVDTGLNTEFGPTLGVTDRTDYSWSFSGLKGYIDQSPVLFNNPVPGDLTQDLNRQVTALTTKDGDSFIHYAPWIFADTTPNNGDHVGEVYWISPGDTLLHLLSVYDALPAGDVKNTLFNYIKNERKNYPPESLANLPLDQGNIRGDFANFGTDVIDQYKAYRPDVFQNWVPLSSFYTLAHYYQATGEAIPNSTWQQAQSALDQIMKEQDWATLSWFSGFKDRSYAVENANRYVSGLIGYTRLAQQLGASEEEQLGRTLFAKAVVQRVAMAKYPRYLYSAGLVALPQGEDWQVRYLATHWVGALFNYHWSDASGDARQVKKIDQFGVVLDDISASYSNISGDPENFHAHLIAFQDMVPEVGDILRKYALVDAMIYVDKVEDMFPTWYAAFSEGMLGMEHNLSLPIDSYQIFEAKTWIQQDSADDLEKYVDIPWLQVGDLYYLQKLADVIKTYRGICQNDSLHLYGVADDGQISLSWEFCTGLPNGTTWQISIVDKSTSKSSTVDLDFSKTSYTIENLTNNRTYQITIRAINNGQTLLTSNVLELSPIKTKLYLPTVHK